ncbi:MULTISPECIES: DUF427 domain-containing protein [unclassified Thiocapsa]|uniref:DUF427 domain-containing protein n=1 Tax=unclassified Thiocapsa TaxID=2641286 RepID=UPI0035AE80D8
MVKAVWKDCVIAENARVEEMDGYVYFPIASVRQDLLRPSERRSVCPKKGQAHYFHIVVGDDCNVDAAWRYPDPKPSAARIADHLAFWRGVEVVR